MLDVIIEETKWEDLMELRDHEENSYSVEQAVEAYKESKDESYY